MPAIKDVIRAYDAFWIRFLAACKGNPLFPTYLPYKYIDHSADKITILFSEPLHLISWPFRASTGKNIKVIILLDAYEIISLRDLHVIKSGVHATYYRNDNNFLTPLENLHYDYEDPPGKAHPLFHVQMSSNLIKVNQPSIGTHYRYKKLNDFTKFRFKYLRIPCPHMNLVSVLTSIVADHLGNKILQQLIEDTKIIENIPRVYCDKLFNSISKDKKNFRCHHWYRC